ncbi:hypothetical protein FSARC_9362 [Fusarium sarcochroum]|uniref:Peroxin 11C n=1 Tax=Fusarium sarcochroum TaxID=1208366 RepID=A0A8H4X679_9HYPO|nr:hypothetical protein FSARC_9362 [Fusarium sarcochroum]
MKSSLFKSNDVDQFLAHLHRAIEPRGSRDVVLLFAGEAIRMIAFTMELLTTYLRREGRARKSNGFSNTFFTGSRITSIATSTSQVAVSMGALADMLAEWQVMNRLWGALSMWIAAKDLFLRVSARRSSCEPVKVVDTTIQALQTICLTSFHICEATVLLSSRKIVKWSAKVEERLTFLAIRSWAAFTMIEIGRLSLDWTRMTQGKEKTVSDDWKARWKEDMLQNLAWGSVALHWSLRNGLLPEALVSPLAVFATWSLMKDAWKSSA